MTGWVSYDRDLTTERATLAAMNATMADRGPDAGGGWPDTHAALGHRRLAVIDLEGGAQPMTVTHDGRTLRRRGPADHSCPRRPARQGRASMATGLEVRVPFCDHRLVEYVFNAPWAMKTFDGREKSLLRAATRDAGDLRELLAERDAPVRNLLDLAAAADAVDGAPGPDLRNSAEVVLALDTWLRNYDVTLDL
jgi:asparagine synthetase B (glutamine-hydrolysing)